MILYLSWQFVDASAMNVKVLVKTIYMGRTRIPTSKLSRIDINATKIILLDSLLQETQMVCPEEEFSMVCKFYCQFSNKFESTWQ